MKETVDKMKQMHLIGMARAFQLTQQGEKE